MTFFRWSRTAASDATADPSINWAEGMAPSAVNDSARAMMAAAAKYRDDVTGATITGGGGGVYTLSTYQQFDSLSSLNNQIVAFTASFTNTGACALNVDGLGNKTIQISPGVDVPAGTLVSGTPYIALYNASAGIFYLHGFYGNPYNIPIGASLDFWGASAPNSSFALMYGQAISRTTYSALFGLFGTTYGGGDGTSTFNIPDLRGRVTAGVDNMGGSAASRLTSSYFGANASNLGATGGVEYHTLITAELPAHYHDAPITDPGHNHIYTAAGNTGNTGAGGAFGNAPVSSTTSTSTTGVRVNSSNGLDKTGNTGSGAAHAIVQPTIVVNKLLRII